MLIFVERGKKSMKEVEYDRKKTIEYAKNGLLIEIQIIIILIVLEEIVQVLHLNVYTQERR